VTRGAGVVVLAALLSAGCPSSSPEEATDETASKPAVLAPQFSLPDLDGNQVELAALRGRVVVIDFWATWCAPCVFQIPVLNEFQERHQGDGVVVLGVSVDLEGDGVVREFAQEHGVRYPVLLGDESLAREFGAMGFPSLFVIAPDGSVDFSHIGVIDVEALEEAVEEAREGGAEAGWRSQDRLRAGRNPDCAGPELSFRPRGRPEQRAALVREDLRAG
jgi:thiol-disulfide isomerase/thioredoxin